MISNPLRIAFIGCVDFSNQLLEHLVDRSDVVVAGVITRRSSQINSDFCCLEPVASRIGSPVLMVNGNDQQVMVDFLSPLRLDYLFCCGWSYLLKPSVLAIPARGVIGYHPALLPRNRGRHPLIWALVLGLPHTGSSFFLMDERADAGPLLDQQVVSIGPDDTAAQLYARVVETACRQVDRLIPALLAGTLVPVPQDPAKATSWRKRGIADGRVDWRMSAPAIKNLVRALTRPYPGAHCEIGGVDISIWRAEIGPEVSADLEPGRVLDVDGTDILVKCNGGSVRLLDHGFNPLPKVGECL